MPAARLAVAVTATFLASGAAVAGETWSEEKCRLYHSAWEAAAAGDGTAGLGPGFLSAHAAFLASGCQTGRVCPRSTAEVDFANLLTVLAMNNGMASTFLPFGCPE